MSLCDLWQIKTHRGVVKRGTAVVEVAMIVSSDTYCERGSSNESEQHLEAGQGNIDFSREELNLQPDDLRFPRAMDNGLLLYY